MQQEVLYCNSPRLCTIWKLVNVLTTFFHHVLAAFTCRTLIWPMEYSTIANDKVVLNQQNSENKEH